MSLLLKKTQKARRNALKVAAHRERRLPGLKCGRQGHRPTMSSVRPASVPVAKFPVNVTFKNVSPQSRAISAVRTLLSSHTQPVRCCTTGFQVALCNGFRSCRVIQLRMPQRELYVLPASAIVLVGRSFYRNVNWLRCLLQKRNAKPVRHL